MLLKTIFFTKKISSWKNCFLLVLRWFLPLAIKNSEKIIRNLKATQIHESLLLPNNCKMFTTKNTVISPDFLVFKFCGKAQFPYRFGRIVRNYTDLLRIIKTKPVENTYDGVLLFSVFLNILIQCFKINFILHIF